MDAMDTLGQGQISLIKTEGKYFLLSGIGLVIILVLFSLFQMFMRWFGDSQCKKKCNLDPVNHKIMMTL